MQDCNFDGAYKFPGMIVFDGDVRQWMGITEDGLDDYIDRHMNGKEVGLMDYKIYKNGEFIETIGDYLKRKKK